MGYAMPFECRALKPHFVSLLFYPVATDSVPQSPRSPRSPKVLVPRLRLNACSDMRRGELSDDQDFGLATPQIRYVALRHSTATPVEHHTLDTKEEEPELPGNMSFVENELGLSTAQIEQLNLTVGGSRACRTESSVSSSTPSSTPRLGA